MRTLITNIKELLQVDNGERRWSAGKDMALLPSLKDAWLLINDERIEDYGSIKDERLKEIRSSNPSLEEIDVTGRIVMPTFCDSHTHIVYANSREQEYINKIKGLSYEEIAKQGGGILNSAKALAETSEERLYEEAFQRVQEMASYGTGAIEVKSGYGLDTENEVKMLRVVRQLKETCPISIKSTLLAAHGIPMEYRGNQTKYIDYIITEMIPTVAGEDLADYIDVFCDKGFFTVEDTDRILNAGMKYGLRAKIHANELDFSGGVQVGVKYNALSVDHLEHIGDAEIACLNGSETMPTVLPGAAFFLNMPYSPVRTMIDSGLPIALASDYNPGSSPAGNMKFICSLGCINYKMLPEEVINATTLNTAYAMGVEHELGSIAPGKYANFIITAPIPSVAFIPYAYGSDIIEHVFLKGQCY